MRRLCAPTRAPRTCASVSSSGGPASRRSPYSASTPAAGPPAALAAPRAPRRTEATRRAPAGLAMSPPLAGASNALRPLVVVVPGFFEVGRRL